jgi:hypothetical protein
MINLKNIEKLWSSYQKMPFPDKLIGNDINNICVTTLDTFAAGCVSTYLLNGSLDRNRIKILKSCLEDLDSISPHLFGYPKEYFHMLKEICVGIVKNTN